MDKQADWTAFQSDSSLFAIPEAVFGHILYA